jgi:hypothetical protein
MTAVEDVDLEGGVDACADRTRPGAYLRHRVYLGVKYVAKYTR